MACKGPPIPSIPPNPQQQTTDNVLYFWFVLSCVLCLARLLTYYYIHWISIIVYCYAAVALIYNRNSTKKISQTDSNVKLKHCRI